MLLTGNLIVSMEEIDICIVGAGVLGLALAFRLSQDFPATVIAVIEQHSLPGQETSSRNSEVIHAGLYYRPGSLKARCCIDGRELLYAFCHDYNINVRKTGKLIVAQAGEEAQLQTILENANLCGVDTLQLLSVTELRRREPEVQALAAIWSPDTGIIDSHAYLETLAGLAQRRGVIFANRTRFNGARYDWQSGQFRLAIQSGTDSIGPGDERLRCRVLINSAGLGAAAVADTIHLENGLTTEAPKMLYSKGNYFSLTGPSPFQTLVYPVPDISGRGLGIHATLDLQGRCRFGPDVEPLDQNVFDPRQPDYRVDPNRMDDFVGQIRRYYPGLCEGRLMPDYSGIRARALTGSDETDFDIRYHWQTSAAAIHLLGIESPGLTASLAIAARVSEQIHDSRLINKVITDIGTAGQ